MLTREALHRLVDDLPEDLIDRAGDSIRRLADPVRWAVENAPLDDEPVDPEDAARWDALRGSRTARRLVTTEKVEERLRSL
ncbi:MAG: hypothetical protein ACKVT1_10040 [Dehalococcoidia bacterium]